MAMQKVMPDAVKFAMRLPREVDVALRRRAAEQWMDRNTYVRSLIVRDQMCHSKGWEELLEALGMVARSKSQTVPDLLRDVLRREGMELDARK